MKFFALCMLFISIAGISFSQRKSFPPDWRKLVKLTDADSTSPSVETILAYPELKCVDPNCRVISFDIVYVWFGADINVFHANGSRLTQIQIEYLRKMLPKDRIFFENIRLRCGDADTTVWPIYIKAPRQ